MDAHGSHTDQRESEDEISPDDEARTRLVVDSIRDDVRRIRNALARLETGTYGQCVTCGSMITRERLEAIPTADHCARCA